MSAQLVISPHMEVIPSRRARRARRMRRPIVMTADAFTPPMVGHRPRPLELARPEVSPPDVSRTSATSPLIPNGPRVIDVAGLWTACEQIAHRLLGLEELVEPLAADAVRSAVSAALDRGVNPTPIAIGEVVEPIVRHHDWWRSSGRLDPMVDPHLSHRTRLVRDLRRHDPRARAILAVRHLADLGVTATASVLDIDEAQVRTTSAHWWPEDARLEELTILRSLDSWAGGSRGPTTCPLAHLDQPRLTAPRSVATLDDLPTASFGTIGRFDH